MTMQDYFDMIYYDFTYWRAMPWKTGRVATVYFYAISTFFNIRAQDIISIITAVYLFHLALFKFAFICRYDARLISAEIISARWNLAAADDADAISRMLEHNIALESVLTISYSMWRWVTRPEQKAERLYARNNIIESCCSNIWSADEIYTH